MPAGRLRRPRPVCHSPLALMVTLVSCLAGPSAARSQPTAVTITRDTYGVPHVAELDPVAAAYALGYAAAEDRLWQMELFRRAGEGRLAEILGNGPATGGASALQMDEVTRRDG